MKLKSFRIFRYKSIVDSGECTLSSDFTILIGKNESGKTAILEALRDFDRDQRGISSSAVTINGMHGNPELEMTFEISAADIDAVIKEAEISVPDELRQKISSNGMIRLCKTFEGEYRFKDSTYESFFGEPQPAEKESDFDRITAKKQRLSEILNVYPIPDLKIGNDIQALQESITDLRRLVKTRLNFINDESQKVEAVEILHSMTNSVSAKAEPSTPRYKFMSALIKQLPRFIYFSDFKDILPFEISIDALKGNQTVCDFARLAQLDLDAVISTQDVQRRINLLNRASASITGAFFDHWEQDRIELIARPEGNKILFGVKEHSGTDFYKMEQRSRGFQWFLSFYLRINRYQNENAVLLIDEPGMNLHPTAQKNIIKVIEQKTSPSMRIIFSTHSSSLIDTERLDRIRYIVKTKALGSVIITGITDAVDDETLTPVSTAASASSAEQLRAQSSGKKILKESQPAVQSIPSFAEQTFEPKANTAFSADVPAAKQPALAEKTVVEKDEAQEDEAEYTRPKSLFNFLKR